MTSPHPTPPTVVFVHGAFADSSGWKDCIARLQAQGLTALAVANPLRGLLVDAEYVRAFLGTIDGPIVLVGHSYGGAVITNAATGNDKVLALVYINAFALDEGETVSSAIELGGGTSDLVQHVVPRPFPGAEEGNADVYLDPAFYPELFCQDLPPADAAALAATQRPAALVTLGAPSGPPAWRSIQSWYLVSSNDRVIPPEAERFMAERAEAHTVEIESSHVAMMSHPDAVAKLVLDAIKVSAPAARAAL